MHHVSHSVHRELSPSHLSLKPLYGARDSVCVVLEVVIHHVDVHLDSTPSSSAAFIPSSP